MLHKVTYLAKEHLVNMLLNSSTPAGHDFHWKNSHLRITMVYTVWICCQNEAVVIFIVVYQHGVIPLGQCIMTIVTVLYLGMRG